MIRNLLLAVAAILLAGILDVVLHSQPTASCGGFIIADGKLTQTDHGREEGYAEVGEGYAMMFLPANPLYNYVKERRNELVQIIIRPVTPRQKDAIER